jgi:energy-coupling factor transporter transmembrane protein EcfT
MGTFKRYLFVFIIIGCVIFLIGFILIAIDKTLFKWKFILSFILAICIYIFPMFLYLSHQASIVELKIGKLDENVVTEIDSISINDCNRKEKKIHGNAIIYSMNNKFGEWLTNPIRVSDYGEYVILEVPRAYVKHYNQFNIMLN